MHSFVKIIKIHIKLGKSLENMLNYLIYVCVGIIYKKLHSTVLDSGS